MVQLLVKDLRIQKPFIAAGFLFVGVVFFLLGALESLPIAAPAAIFSHFLIVVASKMDERNNNGRFLASLPLTRKDVVTAKYIGAVMFMALAFLLTAVWSLLAGFIFPAKELPWFSTQSFIMAIAMLILFYSIYFPLFFAYGARIVQTLDVIVLFVLGGLIIAVLHIADLWGADLPKSIREQLELHADIAIAITAAICVVLLAASWRLAVSLYERKNI